MGRKAWKPSNEDLKMIELMCIAGVTHHQIAEDEVRFKDSKEELQRDFAHIKAES